MRWERWEGWEGLQVQIACQLQNLCVRSTVALGLRSAIRRFVSAQSPLYYHRRAVVLS